jgi:hypothetical protein
MTTVSKDGFDQPNRMELLDPVLGESPSPRIPRSRTQESSTIFFNRKCSGYVPAPAARRSGKMQPMGGSTAVRVSAAAAVLAAVAVTISAPSPSHASVPRTTFSLHSPRAGKIAVGVLRFRVPVGAGTPQLRRVRPYAPPPTTATAVGVAKVPQAPRTYVAVVAIVGFDAQSLTTSAGPLRPLLRLAANRGFTVDFAGDAERYRGGLTRALRSVPARAWRATTFRRAVVGPGRRYGRARTLLDEVRRVLLGLPRPAFIAALRGSIVPPSPLPLPPHPPPPPPPPAPSLKVLSADPYTNASSQHRTEVEPDSYAFGSTIVTAFQAGRFYDGGSSNIGFATSTDSGATWTSGFLSGLTMYEGAGAYPRVTDPSVAYDAKHGVWLIESLAVNELPSVAGVAVLVSRSADGSTWSAPVVVGGGSTIDKSWIVCDNHPLSPHYGNCYSEWDDVADGDRIRMSTSGDGGLTWAAALKTHDNAAGFAGQPLVGPDGTVVVPIANPSATAMLFFASTDGGASWGDSGTIAAIQDHPVAGGLRSEPVPSAEIDAAGTLYVAWQDCRFRTGCSANDIVMSRATASGNPSWSAVTRVPIDAVTSGIDHFIPGLGVDSATSGPGAELALAYYYYPDASCTPVTCQLDVGFVTSTDGGGSWSVSRLLAGPMSLAWLPSTSLGPMVGDYISTSFAAGKPYPFFAVANAPSSPGQFDEAIATVTNP